MMEYRPLDISVISADDLKNVNKFTTMDVYVVVSVTGDYKTKRKTHVDKNGGTNPRWNHRIKFTLEESSLSRDCLLFQLKSDRSLGDKDIGEVSIPTRELLDNASASTDNASERVVEYPVRTVTGKIKGSLKISYKFGEKFTQAVSAAKKFDEPVTAYPAPNCGASKAYPPQAYAMPPPVAAPYPQPGGGYAHPAYGGYQQPPPYGGGGYPHVAPGYGYPPPQQMGYGYPPVQQPMKNKKKMCGSKLGLGLGAGLLGGLLVGDMISDVGEMASYDAGYDAGFDDAGDFDF